MILRICLLISLLLTTKLLAQETAIVSFNPKTNKVSYSGKLTESGLEMFINLLDEHRDNVRWLEIESEGGEINTGMSFGEIIHKNKLNVSIPNYCLSSCANYVFTAANKKSLGNNALVGFHGGASSEVLDKSQIEEQVASFPKEQRESIRNQITAQLAKYIESAQKREKLFFQRIGVNQEITTLGHAQQYKSLYDSENYVAWFYENEDLEKLGVKNVHVTNPPWRIKQLSEKAKVYKVRIGI
jgi:hypothetical protein